MSIHLFPTIPFNTPITTFPSLLISDPFSLLVSREYMRNFDFSNLDLDTALRNFLGFFVCCVSCCVCCVSCCVCCVSCCVCYVSCCVCCVSCCVCCVSCCVCCVLCGTRMRIDLQMRFQLKTHHIFKNVHFQV